jgi:hypothetical protein
LKVGMPDILLLLLLSLSFMIITHDISYRFCSVIFLVLVGC